MPLLAPTFKPHLAPPPHPAGLINGDLPIEVLRHIGEYMDGSSLYAGLQVSWKWMGTLSPLVWTTLTALQFQHPAFPLRHISTVSGEPDDTIFSYHLRRTTTLEWTDITTARMLFPGRVSPISHDIPIARLVAIINMAPRLRRLSIRAQKEDENYDGLLAAIAEMQQLEELHLELPDQDELMDLNPFRPVLSRLKELVLNGDWAEMGCVRFCQYLEYLQLLESESMTVDEDLPHLSLLSNCPKLKDLHFPFSAQAAHMEGFEAAMSALTELEVLTSLNLAWPAQAEMLNSGRMAVPQDHAQQAQGAHEDEEAQNQDTAETGDEPGQGQGVQVVDAAETGEQVEQGQDNQDQAAVTEVEEEGEEEESVAVPATVSTHFAFPVLRTLEVTAMHLTLEQEERFVSNLFFQPRTLERLVVTDLCVVPLEALVTRNWQCTNLKELSLAVAPPDEEHIWNDVWLSFYQRVGRLPLLHTLRLVCTDLGKESGNLQELSSAVSLRRLTLLDEGTWEHQELHDLMNVLPGLKHLELSPLSVDDHVNILLWLGEV
ncbi:hypothetical protein BG015_005118, partial [Linnemannia schmuckeri]